jgi:hypothetical protein
LDLATSDGDVLHVIARPSGGLSRIMLKRWDTAVVEISSSMTTLLKVRVDSERRNPWLSGLRGK